MSTDNTTPERIARLEQRIAELAAEGQRRAASKLRRKNLTTAAGILLAVLCIFGLGAVTRLGKQLDADAVAEIGRAELVAHLPASRVALERYLRAEAPRLVSESVHSLLALLPQVRRLVTEGLVADVEAMNHQFEDEFAAWAELEIVGARERLQEDYPHMGEREQLEMLVADLSANFSANFALSTDALYPRYRAEMDRVRTELVALQHADPARLTDEQRTKKDIIETMLRLILREQLEHGAIDGPI
jgi:hypothetical protein